MNIILFKFRIIVNLLLFIVFCIPIPTSAIANGMVEKTSLASNPENDDLIAPRTFWLFLSLFPPTHFPLPGLMPFTTTSKPIWTTSGGISLITDTTTTPKPSNITTTPFPITTPTPTSNPTTTTPDPPTAPTPTNITTTLDPPTAPTPDNITTTPDPTTTVPSPANG